MAGKLTLSDAERNLVLRIRQLTRGQYLVILDIGRVGLDSLTVLAMGKEEWLRPIVQPKIDQPGTLPNGEAPLLQSGLTGSTPVVSTKPK